MYKIGKFCLQSRDAGRLLCSLLVIGSFSFPADMKSDTFLHISLFKILIIGVRPYKQINPMIMCKIQQPIISFYVN